MAPAAQAAPGAEFQLSKPAGCLAGGCRVVVRYDTGRLHRSVLIDVDWDHRRPVFVPRTSLRCAPAGSPDAAYSTRSCSARSPAYTRVGTTTVALRVTDADGTQSTATQSFQVRARRARSRRGAGRGVCGPPKRGEQCGPGNGRRTPGGGEKVPHTGWPAVTGILWMVLDSRDHRRVGGPDNDELLGHHGSDRIDGAGGHDILWGDWDPKNNNTRQRDTLRGGPGNDWLYPSHGASKVYGGPGRDHVWAYYGRGLIDCGPGRDTARVRWIGNRFRLRGCEKINHFCGHGSDGRGGCLKPGERRARRKR